MVLFRLFLRVAVVAVMALAAPVAWAADPAPVVRVVFNTDPNPPIAYGSGTAIDPDKPSLIVELLRMVGERTGIVFEFQRVPWQRGLYLIEHGQADAIFASSYSPERARYGAYPMVDGKPDERRKIYQQSYSLFVRKGADLRWTGDGISGLRAPVGAFPNFAVVPMLQEKNVPLDLEPSVVGNLRKLAGGRIDAYAEIDTLAEAAIKENGAEFEGIVKLAPPLRTTPYYLMFSKLFQAANPALVEQVWDAIATVRATPAYQGLVTGKYAN
ncbi:hypothetical protein A6A05_18900 [Magnetospirillum moscoviense]|uniref:Solute-binding protein family 3/N-terminal domain-containing protein n=2 Tax=Magnetospirillum moscoviense TaxID=1437059 RepID=A0A178N148_9PROT|nr:hypothetical protein A6A05_18900 [Magnetospirillum moscoviense]